MKSAMRAILLIAVIGLGDLSAPGTALRAYAEPHPKILLLNSDASVEKYQVPQKEFCQAISFPVNVVDLGEKKWRLPEIEELVYDEDPDLIYCIGSKAFLMVHTFAGKTPLVFSSVVNWLRLPVTKRTYGVSNELHAGMEMMLFRYIFPSLHKIGVLYSTQYTGEWFQQAQEQARQMELTLVGKEVSGGDNVLEKLQTMQHKIDAFWLIPDPTLLTDKGQLINILKMCNAQKIPVFSYHEAFVKFGVLLAVSVDTPTIGRQAAGIATQLLSGEKPDEPVQCPAGSYIILNLKKVQEYDLPYNEEALDSVNTLIQ